MSDVVSDFRLGIGVVGNVALQAGEMAAVAACPWLGLPFIKQIWEAVLGHFVAGALVALEDSSTRILLPIIDQGQASAAQAASDKYQADLANEKTKSEALTNDLNDLKAKYAKLIRMRTADT